MSYSSNTFSSNLRSDLFITYDILTDIQDKSRICECSCSSLQTLLSICIFLSKWKGLWVKWDWDFGKEPICSISFHSELSMLYIQLFRPRRKSVWFIDLIFKIILSFFFFFNWETLFQHVVFMQFNF